MFGYTRRDSMTVFLDLSLPKLDTIVTTNRVIFLNHCIRSYNEIVQWFLADRTNGRAYATVLRLSSVAVVVVVCNVMYSG